MFWARGRNSGVGQSGTQLPLRPTQLLLKASTVTWGEGKFDRRSSVQRRSEQAPAPAVERLTNTEGECFRALNFPRPPFTKQNGPHYSHANEFASEFIAIHTLYNG